MLILTRFVMKNDFFFMSGSRKLMLNIFKNGKNKISERSERQQGEVVRVQGEVKIFLLLHHFSHSRGNIVAFVCYNVLVMH
jgi:hypothetical protein